MSNLAKHRYARFTADGAVSATPIRIYALMLVASADAARAELTNDANGAGTNIVEISAPLTDTRFVDFSELGPIEFTEKCYVDVTGTTPVLHVWYD